MVKENYDNWGHLLTNFPCETLKEINRLWLQNSNNRFGISIQAEIYQSLGSPTDTDNNWGIFGERVGWKQNDWLSYHELMEKLDKNNTQQDESKMLSSSLASLPIKIYTRVSFSGALPVGLVAISGGWLEVRSFRCSLFSRAETCKVFRYKLSEVCKHLFPPHSPRSNQHFMNPIPARHWRLMADNNSPE